MVFLAFIDDEEERTLFERLYNSYRKQMHAVARSVLKNDMDSEDAVHDAFLKLAKKHMPTVSRIEDERDRRNYLLTMTKNIALNMIRDKKRVVDTDGFEFGAFTGCRQDLDDDAFFDMICNNIECGKFYTALNGMKQTYKETLYYHFVLEMTIPQTAKVLGLSVPAIKQRLVRGKKILLETIGRKREEHVDHKE